MSFFSVNTQEKINRVKLCAMYLLKAHVAYINQPSKADSDAMRKSAARNIFSKTCNFDTNLKHSVIWHFFLVPLPVLISPPLPSFPHRQLKSKQILNRKCFITIEFVHNRGCLSNMYDLKCFVWLFFCKWKKIKPFYLCRTTVVCRSHERTITVQRTKCQNLCLYLCFETASSHFNDIWIESDSNNHIFTFLFFPKRFFRSTKHVSLFQCQFIVAKLKLSSSDIENKNKNHKQSHAFLQFQNIWLSIIIKIV